MYRKRDGFVVMVRGGVEFGDAETEGNWSKAQTSSSKVNPRAVI